MTLTNFHKTCIVILVQATLIGLVASRKLNKKTSLPQPYQKELIRED